MYRKILYFILITLLLGCNEDDNGVTDSISVIASSINGAKWTDGMENISPVFTASLTFDYALDPQSFKSAFSIVSSDNEIPFDIAFSNTNSKATITAHLKYATTYTLKIKRDIIGVNAKRLKQPFVASFSTSKDDTIRSMPPCTNGCIETFQLTTSKDKVDFDLYSNYPIFTKKAKWEKLTSAIIVVHGQNRDADNYYAYLTGTLTKDQLEENTLLIAPWFKSPSKAEDNDLSWSSNNWREGQQSDNAIEMSSFAVVDSLIKWLANKEHFPVLHKIIITGHSSGGTFANLYAGVNKVEQQYTDIEFEYIVANSQYYYYLNNYRYNEQTQDFYIPTGCPAYNYWPLGFHNIPAYLNVASEEELNQQFIERNIIYLIGNGAGSDGPLNLDCPATLLGSSRFSRGENIIRFMEKFYPDNHSSKIIVEGIGHDGKGMYQSPAFNTLMQQFLK